MLLNLLVKDLDFITIKGDLNKEVHSISYDSREVETNSLFVAISGFNVDGHHYIKNAIENGANTIIVEKDIEIESDDQITILKVSNSRRALAKVSATFYHFPTERLDLIGITGTNGKTSITYFLKSIFEQVNKSIGLIGTIGTVINNELSENKNTTPESLNLQQTFSEMVKRDIDYSIIEVSSHALNLNRVDYCSFNTGVFTNLSPDHLELHNNMEEYFNAKAILFDLTKDYNIVNIDDEYGRRLIEKIKDYDTKLITYGIEREATIRASNIHYMPEYSIYTAHTPKGSVIIKVNLPGDIYVYNSLAAIACAYSYNIDLQNIQQGISEVDSIKGRLEVVYKDDDFKILVDFAHTEDSLEKALKILRPFTKGRIILVFGVYAATGEKGLNKRRSMGRVAAKYADFSIVTSDNPKDQDPKVILKEIEEAIKEDSNSYKVIEDRMDAIKYAIEISQKNDCIFIAGKGHETSQIIGDKEIPFNETEIVMETLKHFDQHKTRLKNKAVKV